MIVILYSSQKHFKCMIGWYRQHLLLAFYFKEYFCNLLILCLKRLFHILKAYFLLYGNYCLSNQRINTQLNKFKLAKCFPGALIKKCVGSLKFSFLYKAATSWVKSLWLLYAVVAVCTQQTLRFCTPFVLMHLECI